MKIKDITLLTYDEYITYLHLIPKKEATWWLQTPNNKNSAYYVDAFGTVGCVGYCDSSILSVRPVLRITNHDLIPGAYFTMFHLPWIVLDSDIAICNCFIGKEVFNTFRNSNWETSSLKKMLDKWFANQCKKETFYVAIKNKVEYSLVQSLCKKFDIDFVETDFNNLIRYYASVFFAYTPCKRRLIHNNIYDPTRIVSFEEFCDYISEKY